ncbi:ARM repeat-containing protein [Gonapodya prolifera JEL478]|uniref:ARM repeat-containing protein n=1 Tax=Gonapodya prolifera (strain JEL478) TaxID=1344416 RepID=A0A138ZXQ4_GONPJ|nr:ARM repeat-containing protein [Gonapodya prolifera JEL478]|eukprot:KXS09085.1 ARM repeat-containing protein [Gonapodya prolifera JEL478]
MEWSDGENERDGDWSDVESDGSDGVQAGEKRAREDDDDESGDEDEDGAEINREAKKVKREPGESAAANAAAKQERRELKRSRQAAKLAAKTKPAPGKSADQAKQEKLTLETLDHAKKLWEEVRRRNQKEKDLKKGKTMGGDNGNWKQEKATKVRELWALVKGYVCQLSTSHSTSRIIQSLLKHGTVDVREGVGAELLSGRAPPANTSTKSSTKTQPAQGFVELAKTPYGKFLAVKVAAYCPKLRPTLLAALLHPQPGLPRLLRHQHASYVVEEFYARYATAAQRDEMLARFYGHDYLAALQLEGAVTGGWKENAQGGGKTARRGDMKAVMATLAPARRTLVMTAVRGHIDTLLLKTPTLTNLTIAHRLTADYLECFGLDFTPCPGAQPIPITDLEPLSVIHPFLDSLTPHLLHILHTPHGSLAVRLCLLYGTARHRKKMLRSLRGHVRNIAADKHGAEVLIGAMECVDDTVLLSKMICGEIEKGPGAVGDDAGEDNVDRIETTPAEPVPLPDGTAMKKTADLILLPSGVTLLLHVLSPRNPKYSDKPFLESLERLDPIRAATSKKENSVRWKEMCKVVAPRLAEGLVEGGSTRLNQIARSKSKHVVVELLKSSDATFDKLPILRMIALLAMPAPPTKLPPPPGTDPSLDLTTPPLLHRVAQSLLKDLIVASPLPGVPADSPETFPQLMLQALAPNMPAWIKLFSTEPRFSSGAAFIVVSMLECGDAEIVRGLKEASGSVKEVKDAVKKWRKKEGAPSSDGIEKPAARGASKQGGKTGKRAIQRTPGLTGIEILFSKLE